MRIVSMLLTLPALAASLSAQASYPVRKCDTPKEPLGVLHAQGQVSYVMSREGWPDTASLRVVSERGISAAGLRSAAARVLSACRFDRSHDTTTAAVFVVDAIGFDSATTAVTPATVIESLAGEKVERPRVIMPVDPLDISDSTIEERPRRISCDPAADVPDFTGAYRTRQDAEAALAQWRRQNSGYLTARITINEDGRIAPEGIHVITSTNPPLIDAFIHLLVSCRYVPARISGIPVPVNLVTRVGIGTPNGP